MLLIGSCTILKAQKDPKARQLLDKASSLLQGNGVEIKFTATSTANGKNMGTTNGTILLKGNKFYLQTPSAKTWFDGKTQWSYLPQNEEVNVSNPTAEELQHINPYALVQIYKNGYNYSMGRATSYKGKSVQQINLKAQNGSREMQTATLYLLKANSEPVCIKLTDKNHNSHNIEVTSLRKGINLNDRQFRFDSKKYPNAEVIDLR